MSMSTIVDTSPIWLENTRVLSQLSTKEASQQLEAAITLFHASQGSRPDHSLKSQALELAMRCKATVSLLGLGSSRPAYSA
ncbi:hypothetical protein DIZ76_017599 [Coccidioides immitis]|nr:hypothetical protein DIZ76_017599 [Coccidioides immitis]